MFADGVTNFHSLGDPSQWGIVANNGISFDFAVLGKTVPGYPLWQRATAPELAEGKPIPREVDIVMISRSELMDEVGKILAAKIGPEFMLCDLTDYWTIYSRRETAVDCPPNRWSR